MLRDDGMRARIARLEHLVEAQQRELRAQRETILVLARELGLEDLPLATVDTQGLVFGPPEPDDGERALVASGKKIAAIKAYRARTGAGLSEAKRAIDRVG